MNPKLVKRAGVVIGVIFLACQFVRPARTNPSSDPARSLFKMKPVPSHVAATLQRACRDCHSNDTEWPWYSNVAPISWFLIDHVNHGRSHFNYSEWSRYDAAESRRVLNEACRLTHEGEMPLWSYLLMHWNARLSKADSEAICTWTSSEPRPEPSS
jgi:heme-binding protein